MLINQELTKHSAPFTKEDVASLIEQTTAQETATKISSDTDYLFLALKKTPKVIKKIKEIQPNTILVSFKLLVNVTQETLFEVAQESMAKNHGDYVLANDLTSIHGGSHTGYLIDKEGTLIGGAQTKADIAKLITDTLLDRRAD